MCTATRRTWCATAAGRLPARPPAAAAAVLPACRPLALPPTCPPAQVMELLRGGELFDAVLEAGRYSEEDARAIFLQLISGVHYMHRM